MQKRKLFNQITRYFFTNKNFKSMQNRLPLDLSLEVENALQQNLPVVALESTIITHGMEYPTNVDTALMVEKCVRENGAVPATIAIIKGRIKVGLEQEQIVEIGKNKEIYHKCSRRDLSAIIARQGYGSTTVAATMICAHLAGIKLFVTGGIGGVHRGAEVNFDISADLQELGKTPVAVVSSGAKSILDLPKTLEYLETQGVPVVGYKTLAFPEFFTSDSGEKCSHQVESVEEAAALILTQFETLKLSTGILIANPIPVEEEANGEKVKGAIAQALKEANENNITGAAITPYLLKRINELTEGDSSRSNIALIKNNAKIGAQIAHKISQLKSKKND